MNDSKGTGLYVVDLLSEWNLAQDKSITMKHPFACGEAVGAQTVRDLALIAERPLASIRVDASFADDNVRARCWTAQFQGHAIKGVTATLRKNDGVEVRIMLGSFPATGHWRDEARRTSNSLLPDDAWELPAGTDMSIAPYNPNQPLDAKLPFQITDDIAFNSPVLTKTVSGAKDVELVIGHASAVYGTRVYGPRLVAGPMMLSFWTASVSGVPIEVANLIRLDEQKRVNSMTMSMQPWPAVKLFRDRARARTKHFLDRSYFELD